MPLQRRRERRGEQLQNGMRTAMSDYRVSHIGRRDAHYSETAHSKYDASTATPPSTCCKAQRRAGIGNWGREQRATEQGRMESIPADSLLRASEASNLHRHHRDSDVA